MIIGFPVCDIAYYDSNLSTLIKLFFYMMKRVGTNI